LINNVQYMKHQKLEVKEPIIGLKGCNIAEFWTWAYSDIMSNRNRSIFAEFLIAYCLGVIEKPRIEWDATDIYYKDKHIFKVGNRKRSRLLYSIYQRKKGGTQRRIVIIQQQIDTRIVMYSAYTLRKKKIKPMY